MHRRLTIDVWWFWASVGLHRKPVTWFEQHAVLEETCSGAVKLSESFHQPRAMWLVLMRRVRHQVPVQIPSFEYVHSVLVVAPSQSGEVCFSYPTSILCLWFHSIHQSDLMSCHVMSCPKIPKPMPRWEPRLRPTRWLWYKPTGENSSRQAELGWRTPPLWLQKHTGFVQLLLNHRMYEKEED